MALFIRLLKRICLKPLCACFLCSVLIFTDISAYAYGASYSSTHDNGTFAYDFGVFLSINDSQMSRLKKYRTVVIDASAFSKKNIQKLKKQGHIVYTYLNVGSLETFRSDYDKYLPYTIAPYENWENERWVDVSNVNWQKRISALAKKYHQKGVDGYFVDNCDIYYVMGLRLDGKEEQKVSSAKLFKGLSTILRNLRKTYKKDVVLNGGNTFVKACMKKKYKLSNYLTAVNQECVYTHVDFKQKRLEKSSAYNRKTYLSYLKSLPKSVDVFLVEYTKSKSVVKRIAKECRKNGYKYYVTDAIKLD